MVIGPKPSVVYPPKSPGLLKGSDQAEGSRQVLEFSCPRPLVLYKNVAPLFSIQLKVCLTLYLFPFERSLNISHIKQGNVTDFYYNINQIMKDAFIPSISKVWLAIQLLGLSFLIATRKDSESIIDIPCSGLHKYKY